MPEDVAAKAPDEAERPEVAQISRELVSLYKSHFGRGPVKARTYWAGDDVIVTVLEQSLTPAEQKLVEMGEHQRLRDVRMFFQYATVKEFVEPIERITGRTVRSFVSGIDSSVDVSIETFVLHPPGSDEPSRAELPAG